MSKLQIKHYTDKVELEQAIIEVEGQLDEARQRLKALEEADPEYLGSMLIGGTISYFNVALYKYHKDQPTFGPEAEALYDFMKEELHKLDIENLNRRELLLQDRPEIDKAQDDHIQLYSLMRAYKHQWYIMTGSHYNEQKGSKEIEQHV